MRHGSRSVALLCYVVLCFILDVYGVGAGLHTVICVLLCLSVPAIGVGSGLRGFDPYLLYVEPCREQCGVKQHSMRRPFSTRRKNGKQAEIQGTDNHA